MPGGESEDAHENGIPDECERKGDMNIVGFVDLDDLPGFWDCPPGADVPVDPSRDPADLDNDTNVDLENVAACCAAF